MPCTPAVSSPGEEPVLNISDWAASFEAIPSATYSAPDTSEPLIIKYLDWSRQEGYDDSVGFEDGA